MRRATLLGGFALVLASVGGATVAHAQAAVATGVGTPFELAFWQSIDTSNDPSLYEAYLARYPSGTFSEIARAKIIALHGHAAQPAAPAMNAAPTAAPALTVPVAPPALSAPLPAVTSPATYTQTAVAAPASPASTPTAFTQTAVAPSPVAQPAVGQSAVTPPVPTPAPAVVTTGGAANGATLGQLLAALANSQVAGGTAPAAPVTMQLSASQPALSAPAPIMAPASRTLAAGFVLPAQPALVPVATVALPPSFCSAEARNAFHDTVYLPSVNAARQNNDAAAAYMRQLQSMYDQYQLSHDPDTMNAVVVAARTYQQVAQTTFSMQSALVRQFGALMSVPVVPCSQPGQPLTTTLAK